MSNEVINNVDVGDIFSSSFSKNLGYVIYVDPEYFSYPYNYSIHIKWLKWTSRYTFNEICKFLNSKEIKQYKVKK